MRPIAPAILRRNEGSTSTGTAAKGRSFDGKAAAWHVPGWLRAPKKSPHRRRRRGLYPADHVRAPALPSRRCWDRLA